MAGDDREFLDFFADEFWSLRRLGFLLTGDWGEAEELAQEAMVRTFAAWSRVRRYQQRAAYARKVLLNRHRSLLRRAVVEARHALVSRPQAETHHEPDFSGDDLLLWQALRRLPARQRAALVLRYYLDLSEAEVARQLGVPAGTVKSLVHRGLVRLRDRLGAEYADERLTSNTEAEA
jgi:RNA polymerase sigma-70 factor (sigma-E family)